MRLSTDLTPPGIGSTYQVAVRPTPERSATSPIEPTREPVPCSRQAVLFTPASCRHELVSAYPELDSVCAHLGFTDGMSLAHWCSQPEWALLILARAARPPQPAPVQEMPQVGLAPLIVQITDYHHRPLLNELRRLGIMLRDIAHRHPDPAALAIAIGFANCEAAIAARLDFEERTIFPQFSAIDRAPSLDRSSVEPVQDVALLVQAMLANNTQSSHEIGHLLRQLSAFMLQNRDPDLPLVRVGLIAIESDLILHTAKEGGLLAAATECTRVFSRTRCDHTNGTGTSRTAGGQPASASTLVADLDQPCAV